MCDKVITLPGSVSPISGYLTHPVPPPSQEHRISAQPDVPDAIQKDHQAARVLQSLRRLGSANPMPTQRIQPHPWTMLCPLEPTGTAIGDTAAGPHVRGRGVPFARFPEPPPFPWEPRNARIFDMTNSLRGRRFHMLSLAILG